MSIVSLFYDYVDVDGINIIKAWLDQQDVRVRVKVQTRLNALEQMNRTEWKMPMTEVLTGDKDGLIAVRIHQQRNQYRLLGYDGPNRWEFTLLALCTEQNNKYVPLDVGRIAFERKAAVEANPINRRVRHDF